jgi:hypothetical protein
MTYLFPHRHQGTQRIRVHHPPRSACHAGLSSMSMASQFQERISRMYRLNTTPPDQAHSPAASIVKLKNSSKAVAALFGVNEKSIPGAHGPRKPSVSTPCAARGTPRGSDARTEARTPDRGSKLKKHPCTQSTNSFSSGATGTSTLRNRSLTIGSKQFRASMLPMLCELKHSPH